MRIRPTVSILTAILSAVLSAALPTAILSPLPGQEPGPAPGNGPAAGALDPLQPPAHILGQELERALAMVIDAARGAARAGAGYEAARMLEKLSERSPESDIGRAARRQLEDWGVIGIRLSDVTAAEVGERIRRSLEADEWAAESMARARNRMEFGDCAGAAALAREVFASGPRGEARKSCEGFLAGFGLIGGDGPPFEALAAESEAELAGRLERGLAMTNASDLEPFLNVADPEAGRVFSSLLAAAFPEHRLRRREEDRGGRQRFGRFGPGDFPFPPPGGGERPDAGPGDFVRRFNESLREGGAAGAGRGRFDAPQVEAESPPPPEPAPPASARQAVEAARRLAARDPATARDFLRVAMRVHGGSPDAAGIESLLAEVEARMTPPTGGVPAGGDAGPAAEGRGGERSKNQREADRLFSGEAVPDYRIELSGEAMEMLRSRPKEYVRGTFRAGEEVLENVGIRLKGSIGTFRPLDGVSKTAFTIKFNRFNAGQKFHGLRKIILGNGVQSAAYLTDYLGFSIFRDAGLPAPRVAFANVWVNGELYGLYIQVEASTQDFLKGWFEDSTGELYEGPGDITRWEDLELDSDPEKADRGHLKELAEAAAAALESGALEPLAERMDIDHLARYLAVEALIDHWDGYSAPNNYRLYRDPKSGKFFLIPHGADNLFGNAARDVFQAQRGILSRALLGCSEGQAIYRRALAGLLETVWLPERLIGRFERAYRRILPHAAVDPRRNQPMAMLEARVLGLLRFFEERRRLAAWQLAAVDDPELSGRLARLMFQGRGFPFGGPGGGRFGPGGPGGGRFGPGGPDGGRFGPGGPFGGRFGPGGPDGERIPPGGRAPR